MTCIFEVPIECQACLNSGKLQCLLNKPYKKLAESAKPELRRLLKESMESEKRV